MDLIERPGGDVRRHPWELARARFFIRLIDRLGLPEVSEGVLDVGAGDAWFAAQLRGVLPGSTRLACWDNHYAPTPDAAGHEPGPEVPGIELSAERPDGRFGGVLMLDVIEHVEDDTAFVTEIVETSLAPGGWVLVSVPAYQSLFSAHDRALKHFRRYSPGQIRAVLESAGLTVVARGGLFHGLLLLRGAQTLRERRRPRPGASAGIGAWHGGERLTRVLTTVLDAEARVSLALGTSGLPPVPGLSTWAFCRRAGAGTTAP